MGHQQNCAEPDQTSQNAMSDQVLHCLQNVLFECLLYTLAKRNDSIKPTVKPVLSGHSKIDKTKVLMTNGSLMKVKSIAECSPLEHSAIILTCIKQ